MRQHLILGTTSDLHAFAVIVAGGAGLWYLLQARLPRPALICGLAGGLLGTAVCFGRWLPSAIQPALSIPGHLLAPREGFAQTVPVIVLNAAAYSAVFGFSMLAWHWAVHLRAAVIKPLDENAKGGATVEE